MLSDPDELCGIEACRADRIDTLIENLEQRLILTRLILFGSRAKGNHTTWSDYDVCVVSDALEGLPPWRRMEIVLEARTGLRRSASPPMSFACLMTFSAGSSYPASSCMSDLMPIRKQLDDVN
jgi:predicted nucleotidyltransferase